MLVIVKGTKARVVPACMAKFHPRFRNEVYDIDFGFDLIDDRHAVIIDSIE
jgi:hypothetical protein